jgi:hypothetical protein
MATTGATGTARFERARTTTAHGGITNRIHETKASFKTTEFWAMIVLVVAILVSAAVINGGDNGTDQFIARQAWLYVAIIAAGYFVSRGLAKSGTYEPDPDYNPVELTTGRGRDSEAAGPPPVGESR